MFIQRTQVWFLAAMSNGSLSPVTLVLGNLTPTPFLPRYLYTYHIYPHKHIHINKKKVFGIFHLHFISFSVEITLGCVKQINKINLGLARWLRGYWPLLPWLITWGLVLGPTIARGNIFLQFVLCTPQECYGMGILHLNTQSLMW